MFLAPIKFTQEVSEICQNAEKASGKERAGAGKLGILRSEIQTGKPYMAPYMAQPILRLRKKRESILAQLGKNRKRKIDSKPLEFVIREYLEAHRLEVKPSTYARYIEISEKHLIPDLGAKTVADFSLEDGNNYVKALLDGKKTDGTGLAPKTVKDIISLLKQILKYAERKEYIHNSWSYRIGRFITFIPRKIRGCIRCFKEHGAVYTFNRILVHLRLKSDSGRKSLPRLIKGGVRCFKEHGLRYTLKNIHDKMRRRITN